jgi:AcrR family transcriptional regulator
VKNTRASSRGPTSERTARQEAALQTRLAILAAATELFSQKGYHATSIQDVATKIGKAYGVVHWHFEDKESLLVAVLEALEASFRGELMAAVARHASESERDTHTDVLDIILGRAAELMERNAHYVRLLAVVQAELTGKSARVEKALRGAYERVAAPLLPILEEGVARGLVPRGLDLGCATQMFAGMYLGAILQQRLFRARYPAHVALPVVHAMLRRAVLREPETAKRSTRKRRKK